jgi:photosystem II stability/assembly factor-like uncharacterized protein
VCAAIWLVAGQFVSTQSAEGPATPFDTLRFREIGPATMAGRIDDLAVLESDPTVFYVATATGGLWKTTNNGTTFETVFDDESTASVGDVAIAPTDTNLVWVGTGENNNRQSSSWGEGVFKSTDGGQSWDNMGLVDSRQVARIVVDPVDHDVVYVAALGNLWASGGDRGVYRTADGGLTWDLVLEIDEDTGATELLMDPTNNKVLYAATYQRRRSSWGFNGGGPGSGIYKTTDGGENWTELVEGLPEGPKGRIGLDIYRKDPNVLYARVEHPDAGGIYRTDDGGATWEQMSDTNPRPMYFSQIRIDPGDDHRIYVLGVQLFVSDDGGRTFRNTGAPRIHVDFHAMWINPADSRQIILGGDGGVGISYDRSETYVFLNNMPLAQFYHASFDMQSPYTVCGGLQDNNTWCGPSATRSSRGIVNDDWFIVGGGDGFVALVDPTDPNTLYAESQGGRMNRVDRATNERKAIRPEPVPDATAYRWNWDAPMVMSPHDPGTIFVAANRVFKTTDRGHVWETISPDLTTATDRDELPLMGVMGSEIAIARNDGVGAYGTLTTFAESARREGTYYTGADDGQVQVSRDGGATWTNVTGNIPGVPANTYVSRVEASKFADGTVYATFDGHRSGDFEAYVYASRDHGASWESIGGGLPDGEVARTISEDLVNADVLYLGTERGLFVTIDRGATWTRVKANLPTVPIYEVALHPRDNDLILATHGRGIWILDDLTPLQEFERAERSATHFFSPAPAVSFNVAGDRTNSTGDRWYRGDNPPAGAALSYYLADDIEEVTLTVRDGSGVVARTLAGDDVEGRTSAGIQTVHWDLRVQPVPDLGLGGGFGTTLNGPFVLPGEYRVTLHVDGRDVGTETVRVAGDPAVEIADADRRAQFQAAMALHALHERADEAFSGVTVAYEQVEALREALGEGGDDVPEAVSTRLEEIAEALEPVRQRFGVAVRGFGQQNVRSQVTRLKREIVSSTSRPSETQARRIGESRDALGEAIGEANVAIGEVRDFYGDLVAQGLYPVDLKLIAPLASGTR